MHGAITKFQQSQLKRQFSLPAMVVEGMYRNGACTMQTVPMGEVRRGKRWNQPYQRQPYQQDHRQGLPRTNVRNSRTYATSYRGPTPQAATMAAQHVPAVPGHLSKISRQAEAEQSHITRPQFQQLYQEFENLKRKGFVLDPGSTRDEGAGNAKAPPHTKGHNSTNVAKNAQRPGGDNFADAMKIFMRSYLPMSSFTCAKPVDDWSKEAGNLLQELTDNESQSDHDKSVWNIPFAESCSRRPSYTGCSDTNAPTSSRSTTPQKCAEHSQERAGFDIYRHIMEINPSPYPGGSPVSTGQSASNHSSDNDADDEEIQSSAENYNCKAIGARKSFKKRLTSSFSCPTVDSGYLSSANESDSAKGKLAGCSSHDSDVGSESGFTSSTCSWPTSPSRRLSSSTGMPSSRRSSNQGPSPHPTQSLADWHAEVVGSLAHFKNIVPCPPIPPPMPPFLSGFPPHLPPPPQFFAPHFQPAAVQPQAARIPLPPPAVSGFALLPSATPPLQYSHSFIGAPQAKISPAGSGNGSAGSDTSEYGQNMYHKHKAWITDEILEMIAVRDRLYKRMKKHPAPDIVEMYKKCRSGTW